MTNVRNPITGILELAMILLDQLNSNFWRKYHAVSWDDIYFKGGDRFFFWWFQVSINQITLFTELYFFVTFLLWRLWMRVWVVDKY